MISLVCPVKGNEHKVLTHLPAAAGLVNDRSTVILFMQWQLKRAASQAAEAELLGVLPTLQQDISSHKRKRDDGDV